ncbi:MAG: hypothetical protein EBR82_11690 [Caulobacteraceae bacterium]|nr:hypothetical protein [Caulobacteraceae bacterium]
MRTVETISREYDVLFNDFTKVSDELKKAYADMDVLRRKASDAEKKHNKLIDEYNEVVERLNRSTDKLANARFEIRAEKRVNEVLLEVLRLGRREQEAEE